jgi:LacI family transcriptional regulator
MPSGFLGKDALGFLFFGLNRDANKISHFYSSVLMGAQAEAARLGLHFVVDTLPRLRRADCLPKMLREDAVAGMLLVGAAPPEVLAPLQDIVPLVLVDNEYKTGLHDSILADDFNGAMAAIRYLIALGHRKIGFLMNEPMAPSFKARYHGYLSAHFEADIVPDRKWIISAEPDQPIDQLLRPILTCNKRPTAFFAASDFNAFNIMKECRELGVRVPEDVSVIGFDNDIFSDHTTPPLTTIHVDKDYMGQLAVRRLYVRIKEEQERRLPEPAIRVHVPATLLIRSSCAPLASS